MHARFLKNISVVTFILYLFLSCIFSLAQADQQQLSKQLQKALDAAVMNSTVTPGAVLLVSSPDFGTITLASGLANKAAATPMRIDNNFRLASISKTFLAVLVLKLSENDKLKVDDKITKLLPTSINANHIPNGPQLTVKQLLAMRSGVPNYMDYDAYSEMVASQPKHRWIPKDAIEIIYDEKPTFAPDKSYEYSNTNYIILQSIVEQITGKPIAHAFRKYIFEPLHLNNTYVEVQEERRGGFNGLRTHGYELANHKLKDVTARNDGLGLGDGGLISTAQDLCLFVQALLQSKTLLSQTSLNEMLTTKGPDKYGLGIYKEEVDDEWAWTHNGSASGFGTQFYYFPKRKLTLVILTNSYDSDIIEDLAAQTLKIIDEVR